MNNKFWIVKIKSGKMVRYKPVNSLGETVPGIEQAFAASTLGVAYTHAKSLLASNPRKIKAMTICRYENYKLVETWELKK